jgi:hypothetical protein
MEPRAVDDLSIVGRRFAAMRTQARDARAGRVITAGLFVN